MKTFALFLFDDSKNGFERYTYQEDFSFAGDQEEVENLSKILYDEIIGKPESIKTPLTKPFSYLSASTLDMRVTINNVKFASQTVAYIPRNGGKAIVLAERINDTRTTK